MPLTNLNSILVFFLRKLFRYEFRFQFSTNKLAQPYLIILKGQVTFLKLCLFEVCLALIIPIIFLSTTVFRPKKMHLYACASVVFFCQRRPVYAGTATEVMVDWYTKKKNRIHSSVFCKFLIHLYAGKKRLRWYRHKNAFSA